MATVQNVKIVNYPHPALRVKAKPVTTIDRDLKLLAGRMLELMYEHKGLGLAGPQVASDLQIIVMNFEGDPDKPEQECFAINPVIIEQKGGLEEDREGCLSFPQLFQKVRRYRTTTVRAYNLDGQPFEMTCSDLAARLWQHEIDHLHGILFIDKMSSLGRIASRAALRQFEEAFRKAQERGELPKDLVAAK
jgi:peptide deformylase